MRDEPTAADLLETALAVYRDRLLPALPAHLRYDALMVANAVAISARQARAGEAPVEEARRRLAALYPNHMGSLAEMERRLALDIRRGAFDEPGPSRDAVFEHLRLMAEAKAAESNPKALRAGALQSKGITMVTPPPGLTTRGGG
jgi:hypothetical protein